MQAQIQVSNQVKLIVFSSGINLGPTFVRQGPSYVDDRIISVVGFKGPVYYVLADYFDMGYPYRRGYGKVVVLVTPETEYVILRVVRDDNTIDPPVYDVHHIVYIKGYGWWKFEGNDARRLQPLTQQEIAKIIEKEEIMEAYIGEIW